MKLNIMRIIFKLLPILAIVTTIFSIFFYFWASDIGTNAGEGLGIITGTAIGSWNGVTKGVEEGKKEGVSQGLSAEDTRTMLQNEIKAVGQLEVLCADVTLQNKSRTGSKDNPSYQSLEVICGKVVFSVDLDQTVFSFNEQEKTVNIILPPLSKTTEIDVETSQMLFESQQAISVVGSGAGAQAVLDSYAQLQKNIESSIMNYDYLVQMAQEAAINQVGMLADSFSLEGLRYQIAFQG